MQKTLFPSLIIWAVLLWAPAVHAQSILKGHDTYQPLDIAADRLEVRQNPSRALFVGAVKVLQGKMTLQSQSLTVFYAAKQDAKDPKISRLDAQGAVSLVSETESLTGDWAVYDVDEHLITLGGNVVLKQNDNILRGERLEFDLVSGLAKLDGKVSSETNGRVKGRFAIPENQNNKK